MPQDFRKRAAVAVSARNLLLDWAAGAPGNGGFPERAHGIRAGLVNPRGSSAESRCLLTHEPTASHLIGPEARAARGAAAFKPRPALYRLLHYAAE